MASCQSLVVKPQFVNRALPGPEVTDCPDEPQAPSPFVNEAERYMWASAAIYAGRECRATLKKAKEWIYNPPKETSAK